MSDSACSGDDDPIDFAPVPTLRARHDGWTPERQRRFISVLSEWGGVSAAARAGGRPGRARTGFAAARTQAGLPAPGTPRLEEGRPKPYDEAVRRGCDGYVTPVLRGGKVVSHRRRVDSSLLFAACYGEPPSRYGRS